MGLYTVVGSKGSASVRTILAARADATRPRRAKVTAFSVANNETPADALFNYGLYRVSTAGTAASVTPQPNDPADAATEMDAVDTVTVEPTIGVELYTVPLNQRASWRWVAQEGKEFVWPATADNGVGLGLGAAATNDVGGSMQIDEQ